MAYNRLWLQNQMASQLRDNNIASVADNLIDLAISKISIVLESQHNEMVMESVIPATPYAIPGAVNTIRGITYQCDSGSYSLVSVPSHMANSAPESGTPQTYSIKGNKIYINPFSQGTYEIAYFGDLVLGPNDSDSMPALQQYPAIFREAALSEGYAWKEDTASAENYERKFLGAIQEVNRQSQRLRQGDAPAMRAM